MITVTAGWPRRRRSRSATPSTPADHVVLATGSEPRSLPGLTLDGERVITSDDALRLDRVPGSAIILGGGVIGVEFACVWRSFGADVTIVEMLPQLLPLEDEASAKVLQRVFRRRGIELRARRPFQSVNYTDDGVSVTLGSGKRSTPRCCSWRSAAARSRPASATRRPGSP